MSGIEAIAAERQRQINEEGWTSEHDDAHQGEGEMALAAAAYAARSVIGGEHPCGHRADPTWATQRDIDIEHTERLWPWDRSWWKPKSRRENLVRAGALIAAEIDRLDRLELKPK